MDEHDFQTQLKQLGNTIRRLRSAKDFSQEGFASACGLDRTYVGGVERGERNLSFKILLRIAEALDVEPSELLSELSSKSESN